MEISSSDRQYQISGNGICWASIIGGAVAALALTIVLLWLGIAFGFTVVSPWRDSGVSAGTFKIGTGIYLIVIAMISSAIGGHIAGRLRSGWAAVHPNEVYFRDTANGFLSWALASVVGALLLGSASSSIIGAGSTLALGGGAAASQAAPISGYVDQLLRPSAGATAPQQSGGANESREELSRLLASSFGATRDLNADDKAYVAQVVSQRTGLNQQDAEKRVSEVITKAKANLDAARKAAAQLAYWMVAALLIGAFSASIAAAEAGGFRDRNWNNS